MKAHFSKILICTSLLFFMASCSVQYIGTPSGKPELTVNCPMDQAWKPIRTTMKLYGYKEINQTNNKIVFIKSLDGQTTNGNDAWKQLQFPAYNERLTFVLIQNGEKLIIVPTMEMISNMGTQQENKIDVSKCDYYPDMLGGMMSQFINDGLGIVN